DDLRHAGGLAVAVLNGDLALGVRAKQDRLAPGGAARLPQRREAAVGVIDGRRHELRRLVAGIAEHDPLFAGADILVARGVDALGDVPRLAVQEDLDIGLLPMEASLL